MRQLQAAARKAQRALVRLLGQLVRCESSSYDKPGVDRCAGIIAAEWSRRLGKGSVKVLRQRERGDHVRVENNQLLPG